MNYLILMQGISEFIENFKNYAYFILVDNFLYETSRKMKKNLSDNHLNNVKHIIVFRHYSQSN